MDAKKPKTGGPKPPRTTPKWWVTARERARSLVKAWNRLEVLGLVVALVLVGSAVVQCRAVDEQTGLLRMQARLIEAQNQPRFEFQATAQGDVWEVELRVTRGYAINMDLESANYFQLGGRQGEAYHVAESLSSNPIEVIDEDHEYRLTIPGDAYFTSRAADPSRVPDYEKVHGVDLETGPVTTVVAVGYFDVLDRPQRQYFRKDVREGMVRFVAIKKPEYLRVLDKMVTEKPYRYRVEDFRRFDPVAFEARLQVADAPWQQFTIGALTPSDRGSVTPTSGGAPR